MKNGQSEHLLCAFNLPVQIVTIGVRSPPWPPVCTACIWLCCWSYAEHGFLSGFYYFQLLRTNRASAPGKGLGSPSAFFLFAVLQIHFLCTQQKTDSATTPHSNCNFTKRFLVFTKIKCHYHLNICDDLQAKVWFENSTQTRIPLGDSWRLG